MRRTSLVEVGVRRTNSLLEFCHCPNVDERRENAYKAVLVGSLCVTVCAWAIMATLCPILYQFLSFTNSQFDGLLEFCEETASTVLSDSTMLIDAYAQQRMHFNQTTARSRSYRRSGYDREFCRCEAEPGPQGTPGMKGTPGANGAPGLPARLPCEPVQDLKKYCPEKCPQGLQGQPGSQGFAGDKGKSGPIGPPGKNGLDGKSGHRGMPGPPGIPGLDGDEGDPGTDAIATPFVPGPIGQVGEVGSPGPQGPRGMPGIDGPQGPQGRKGQQGKSGLIGPPGTPGSQGTVGDSGEDGHKGVCPTYCAMDGGVFFVEPPEWFFKNGR